MNVVESAKNQLSDSLSNKLGGLFGVKESDMRNLIQAGIPSLMAGLAYVAAKPKGAEKISKALSTLDPTLLGDPERMLESGSLNAGGSLLNNLLGFSLVESIAKTIAAYTHISVRTVNVGLGYLIPFVLGSVGASIGASIGTPIGASPSSDVRCDAASVADLFRVQRGNIVAAIPTQLPLARISSLTAFLTRAARGDLEDPLPRTAHLGNSLVVVAVLATVVVSGIFLFDSRQPDNLLNAPRPPSLTNARPRLVLGDAGAFTSVFDSAENLSKQVEIPKAITSIKTRVKDSMQNLTTNLNNLQDASDTDVLVQSLTEIMSNLNDLDASTKAMPSEGRSVVALLAQSYAKRLNPFIERTLLIPDLSESIRDSLSQIRDKLQAMADKELRSS